MIKAMLTLHKKSTTSGDEFRSYWRGPHAEVASKIPGLRGYTQNHSQDEPEGDAALADIPNFADPERLSTVIVEEVKVI